MTERDDPELPAGMFQRIDEGDDAAFYAEPRFVTHIDDATIEALTTFYRERIPAGARLLDLMSSWVSHLPEDVTYASIVGHGMNAPELAANPRLDAWHVQDLNSDPELPWPEGAFDAALIAVSVQYLTRPIDVFAELARLLAPGGQLIISTSHRCFPTKAVWAFRELPPEERVRLIGFLLQRAGGFEALEFVDRSPAAADPLWIVSARRSSDGVRRDL
ncbi:MAG: methyltransferase domain-containing protein [Gammaproteobacteria bacterium]|nr:MAG: methyltransferase domain-containing protein [Gammaproteobacteria bacterium]